ncbi:MAG TPA: TIR domain-containing protein [Pyrinomonadaceae bacterium]|jgi:small GTP-binding protein
MSNSNEAEKKFKYDVFLSHSSKDKPVVRELAERLKADGVCVWFDEWEIQIGDSIPSKIEQGLEESRILILAMSANAFGSDWVSLERGTAIFRDPQNKQRRFIPLRLDDSEIKETLKQFLYLDWRNKDKKQYDRLLELLSSLQETETVQVKQFKQSKKEKEYKIFEGHTQQINSLAVTPDGKTIVSGSHDNTVRVWDTETGKCLAILKGHKDSIFSVAITAAGSKIVSGCRDGTIKVWERASKKCLITFEGHRNSVTGVSITPDGEQIVSCSFDQTIRIWGPTGMGGISTFGGHTDSVLAVAVTSGGRLVISGSDDRTIRVWDTYNAKCVRILEGHTDSVVSVATTTGGRLIVSSGNDGTVRVWELISGKCIAIFNEDVFPSAGTAITAKGDLIVFTTENHNIRLEYLETSNKTNKDNIAIPSSERKVTAWYTNAKVLLVGDSGVGKSGLAYRLTENRFVSDLTSTDGVWATQLKLPGEVNTDDTEREIWLWDFAGQSDYRLIHQLFMDETSLAVLVFNPQSDNPFEGLGQWDRDLQKAARRPFNKLLVAGRCDRGELTVSQKSIDEFISQRGFAGYLRTSATTGENCEELRRAIIENINWNDIPHRTSPRIFKLLKDEIVRLKDEGKVLLRISELKQQLEMRLPDERFEIEELRAVVGLLAGSGIVWELEFGDFVLLQPERINSYAGALVRSVRAHVEEIGCISEEKVLAGELDYQDIERLPPFEEEIVLRAMQQTFVSRGLCLKEKGDEGMLLVFPSYFRRERPEQKTHPSILVTYQFSGMLDEIYATLVVRLHHTKAFDKHQLWRYAADFKTQSGKIVGLKMTKKAEGAAEVTVYFDKEIPDETKVVFIRYVHDHLKAKDEKVTRKRHYVCPHCETPFENERAIEIRLKKGEKTILCPVCEERFDILDLIEEKFASDEFGQKVREMEEEARIAIDNESRELILVGHAFAVAGEAGQIFRPIANSDWGIDGEIEFKDYENNASGKKVYLQLKSGDSYLRTRKRDEKEIFQIKPRHAEYWLAHNYPVMLVIRTSDGEIRWMNATDYLRKHGSDVRQIVFDGEPFVWQNVIKLRDKLIPPPMSVSK